MSDYLMASDVAAEFHRTESWRRFQSAQDLVDAVDQYVASKGLSRISSLDVADWVLQIKSKRTEPLPTPEQNAWDSDLAEGIGDPPRRGVERHLAAFLTGHSNNTTRTT